MLPEWSLEGRTAIVTGAGKGIGREIALVLAEAGADIVVAARTTADIETTAADVRAMGKDAIAVTTDVTKSADCDALVERAVEKFGKIDIIVNNAGKWLRQPTVPYPDVTLRPPVVDRESTSRTTDEEWHAMIETNISGVFYCCRAIAPHMIDRGYGKIINISSNSSIQASGRGVVYNVTKASVNIMTKALALDWAPYNVCVNALAPGYYETPMTEIETSDTELYQIGKDIVPMGKWGDLRELGVLAVYLASPASDYMTGQILFMDGGLTAK